MLLFSADFQKKSRFYKPYNRVKYSLIRLGRVAMHGEGGAADRVAELDVKFFKNYYYCFFKKYYYNFDMHYGRANATYFYLFLLAFKSST